MNYQAATDYMNSLNKLSFGRCYMVASLSGVATRKLLDAVYSIPHNKESDDCLHYLLNALNNAANKSLYIAVAKALSSSPAESVEQPEPTIAEPVIEAATVKTEQATVPANSKGNIMNTIKRAFVTLAFVAVLISHAFTLTHAEYQTKLSTYVYNIGQTVGVNLLANSIFTTLEKTLDANVSLAAANDSLAKDNAKLAQDNSILADIAANQQFEYAALQTIHNDSLCTKAYNLMPYADKAADTVEQVAADAVNTAKPYVAAGITTIKPFTAKAVDTINEAYATAVDYLTK